MKGRIGVQFLLLAAVELWAWWANPIPWSATIVGVCVGAIMNTAWHWTEPWSLEDPPNVDH